MVYKICSLLLEKIKIKKQNKKIQLFIQVNIGNEDQKSGVDLKNLPNLYNYCKELDLDIVGTMCIPPDDNKQNLYFSNMQKIKIEKIQEILPYVFSSLSGEKQNNNSRIEYENIFSRVGFGINYDFSKTTLFEATINPDFSQVEADVTLIDVNSPVSLQYPERRPFFNRGTDIVNFSQDIYYSRSISSPSFASKLLNQGKKSRFS